MSQQYELVCRIAFLNYKVGDHVTDPTEVATMLAERDNHFVKIPAGAMTVPAKGVPASAVRSRVTMRPNSLPGARRPRA